MIRGCLRNAFAMLGCGTLLLIGGIVVWQYRSQIAGAYRSFTGGDGGTTSITTDTLGFASPEAFDAALEKQERMAAGDGPGLIVMSSAELASLIAWGLDPDARDRLDSIRVTLTDDRISLQALLSTRIFTDELLGPFSGVVALQEPVRMGGQARMAGMGVVVWEPDEFVVRSFPFPGSAVTRLVDRLTGRDDGTIPIAVPATVGDVRIRPNGITFYRRID